MAELSVFTVSLLFSVIFGVFGFNSLLLYFVLRKRVFLCYAVLVFGLAAHVSLPLFRESNPDFFCGISIITAMVTTLGSLWFTETFIGISPAKYPGWSRLYRILAGSSILIVIIQGFNLIFFSSCSFSTQTSYIAALITLSALMLNFVASFGLWNLERLARLYFYLNLPMIGSAVVYVLLWFWIKTGAQIETVSMTFFIYCGMTLQMVLFSVFIGYKIRDAEREKLKLERSVNKKLQEEVAKQTDSLKRAFGEVEMQKGKLEELNALKNKLFSLVAHDLRNPINNLSSLLELTEHGELDSETMKTFTAKTKGDLAQSMMVMERLLYWSSKQLEGIKLQKEKVNFAALAEDVLQELKLLAEDKRIKFQFAITCQHVFFDRDMLRVSLRNLISNAIKFSHEESEIAISCELMGEMVRIGIKDDGLGMDPNWFKKLKHEGRPDVKQGTHGEKGTGFGLLITKDFVEMNGGELLCESKPGEGTTFIMEGPFQKM